MIKDVYLKRILDLKSRMEKEKSFNEGFIVGEKTQKIETLFVLCDRGYDIKEISSIISLSEAEVKQIIKDMNYTKRLE